MSAIEPGDGPVLVTGASGYVGSHVVAALLEHGFAVRACVTDLGKAEKVDHVRALGAGLAQGRLELHQGNLLEEGSYDAALGGAAAVVHVGTAMAYGGANDPAEVYEGAVGGTRRLLDAVRRAGTVRRFVYTSSFAAISHPAPPGHRFTERDRASDGREGDPRWSRERVAEDGEVAYAMAKLETEDLAAELAAADGRFDAIAVCPSVVLGPLLAPAHHLVFSWQWFLGRMLEGKPCTRRWQGLWNVVDVRDVGVAHARILGHETCRNGARYQLTATDASGELDVPTLQAELQTLLPEVEVGGPPPEFEAYVRRHGGVWDGPRAHCDLARRELGLETHPIRETLRTTAESLLSLGLVTPARRA